MKRRIATALMFVSAAALQHAPAASAAVAPETASAGSVSLPERGVVTERGSRHPSMNGVRASAYRGKYYRGGLGEQFRRCVLERESHGHYGSRNSSSTAQGGYQFLASQWQESLPYMLRPELIEIHGERLGRRVFRALMETPIYKWPRFYQDAAFFTVLHYDYPFSGASHWSLAGSRCNQLAGMR